MIREYNFNNTKKQLNNLTFYKYYNILQLLAKSRFKWSGLPSNIKDKWIEKYLYSEGKCMMFKDEIKGLMVTKCNDGGMLNYYDEPTILRPIATNYSGNGESYYNDDECILIHNNDEDMPDSLNIRLFAYRLTEITRTIDMNINAMKTPLLVKGSKKQMLSLKQVYAQYNGNEPVLFMDNDLGNNPLEVLKTDAPIVFDKLQIEKNHIWNEAMTYLGINNANMDKRERLVDDEVQANNEQIEMCAQLALKSRKEACENINRLFGLNVQVEFRNDLKVDINLLEGGEKNE